MHAKEEQMFCQQTRLEFEDAEAERKFHLLSLMITSQSGFLKIKKETAAWDTDLTFLKTGLFSNGIFIAL